MLLANVSDPAELLSNFAELMRIVSDRGRTTAERDETIGLLRRGAAAGGFSIRARSDRIEVNDIPVEDSTSGARQLRYMFRAHHLRAVRVPADLSPMGWVALAESLVAPAGTYAAAAEVSARLAHWVAAGIEIEAEALPAPEESATREIELDPGVPPITTPVPELTRARQIVIPAGDPLVLLEAQPDRGLATMELLKRVVNAAHAAVGSREVDALVDILVRVATCAERSGPDAAAYAIALRRIAVPPALRLIAPRVTQPRHREMAIRALRTGGADATEILARLMASATSREDRRAYFDAIKEMPEGAGVLVTLLRHEEWYVVRNAADLCGEIRLVEAIPALAKLVGHADERVRRSVVAALAKLDLPKAREALIPGMADPSPKVRVAIARAIGGLGSDEVVRALIRRAEAEAVPEVQREILRALGRCGTLEAVDALAKAAQPAKGFFARKPSALRVAAVEGLGLSHTGAARNRLHELASDRDAAVRNAAERALKG